VFTQLSVSLWPTYIGEKGRTLGKTHGIKAKCYWEHPWGTHWEPNGFPLRIWREHVGNKWKWEKIPPPPPHPKLKQKNQGTLSVCWAFPLAARNFYFRNCLSPFLAWANTPIISWGYLLSLSISQWAPQMKHTHANSRSTAHWRNTNYGQLRADQVVGSFELCCTVACVQDLDNFGIALFI